MLKNTVLAESSVVGNSRYTPPIQSADTLFHFVKRIEYLVDVITKNAVIPRYCTENIEYLDIGQKEMAYPMLCFCDINLHKIKYHMDFYGEYGIAFSKQWGLEKGVQPIQYINPYANLRKDFTEAFTEAIQMKDLCKGHDYLLSHMYFLKPIEGDMPREGRVEHKNFTDECEWRFVPNVAVEGFPPILRKSELARTETLNKGIRNSSNLWLKFKCNDIKYIIIKNRKEFENIVDLIIKKDNLSDKEKNILISKVIIWEESKGDF